MQPGLCPGILGSGAVAVQNDHVKVLLHLNNNLISTGVDTATWAKGGGAGASQITFSAVSPLMGSHSVVMTAAGGDHYLAPSAALSPLGAGDFMIDFMFNNPSVALTQILLDWTGHAPQIYLGGGKLGYYDGAGVRLLSAALANDTTYQARILRLGNNTFMLVNGQLGGTSVYNAAPINFTATDMKIGISVTGDASNSLIGKLDEVRWMVGMVIGDGSAYTPSLIPFTDVGAPTY